MTTQEAMGELEITQIERIEESPAITRWRVRAEKAEADLERAGPLLEAAMKWDTYAGIKNWGALADAALAYKEAKDAK